MSDRSDPRSTRPSGAGVAADADEPPQTPPSEQADVDHSDPSGGPTTLGWWLDDGPDSPVAADIKEPEKHL